MDIRPAFAERDVHRSSGFSIRGTVKLHDLACDHEDHSLANVHYPVRGPFQVMGHPDQISGPIDQLGVDNDKVGQLPEDLVIKGIHLIIFHRNRPGQLHIPLEEGLEGPMQHVSGFLGHAGNTDERFDITALLQRVSNPVFSCSNPISEITEQDHRDFQSKLVFSIKPRISATNLRFLFFC